MQTTAIQSELIRLGYDLGPCRADGAWGRLSIAALQGFQTARRLPATGIPDAATLQALFGQRTTAVQPEPVWFAEASRLQGIHEKVGPGSNPVILGWAQTLSAWVRAQYRDDATPWCGLFVGHCVAATLPHEPLPSNPLGALNWNSFGKKLTKPATGAITVFRRVGGGHVAFYVGEDTETVHVLGGNQSDAVNITRVSKSRLVGYRWPTTAPDPTGGPVLMSADGTVSRNEA